MTQFTQRKKNGSQWATIMTVVALLSAIPAKAFHSSTSKPENPRLLSTHQRRGDPATTSSLFAASRDESSAVPPRKMKHKRRSQAPKKGKKNTYSHQVLSETQLRDHVASQYVHGPGGSMRGALAREKATKDMEHMKHLHKLNRHPALLLNADYMPISYLPLSTWNWQESIKAVFSGKVTVVDVYPGVMIRAANLEIPLPSVIALNEYAPRPNTKPAFTKRNVFLRDRYQCQYCSNRFHTRDLSLDHVVPRCMGGILNWENIVTSCRTCNGKKGSLKVNQLNSVGMRLLREPFTPTQFELHSIAGQMLPKKVHSTWTPYLGLGASKTKASDESGANTKQKAKMFSGDFP